MPTAKEQKRSQSKGWLCGTAFGFASPQPFLIFGDIHTLGASYDPTLLNIKLMVDVMEVHCVVDMGVGY